MLLPSPIDQADNGSTKWQTLVDKVANWNSEASSGVSFRVIFLGRHGEGYHNVAESQYGTAAWDVRSFLLFAAFADVVQDYWSKLEGNDSMHWADARLTDKGKQQARLAHDTWEQAIASGLPPPQAYYCSPLDRCLETARLTFGDLPLPPDRKYRPNVKEVSH